MAGQRGTVVLPPYFLPGLEYYTAIARSQRAVVDTTMRFDKRLKATHRIAVADTRGRAVLTVPIEKPVHLTEACWRDIRISSHGHWWSVLSESLQTAYGRSAYFEFYFDDLKPFFSAECAGTRLTEQTMQLHRLMCRLLLIDTPIEELEPGKEPGDGNTNKAADLCDLRRGVPALEPCPEYYQTGAMRMGFIGGLSIVDALFNLGPEAAVLVRELANRG